MHVVCSSDKYNLTALASDLWLISPEADDAARIRLPLASVETLVIQENENLSAQFLIACWKHGIPVVILDKKGAPLAHSTSTKSHGKASLWRRQLSFVRSQLAQEMATNWIYKKQIGQAKLLKAYKHPIAAELARAANANLEAALNGFMDNLAGLAEAQEARRFWTAYGSLTHIRELWDGRQRRPADNIVNAALNYGYGILYGIVLSQVTRRGLHPGLGIIHSEARGQDALVFDLVEPLRPMVESAVLALSLSNKLPAKDFETRNGYLIGTSKSNLASTLFEQLHLVDSASAKTPYQLWTEDLLLLTQAVRKQPRL